MRELRDRDLVRLYWPVELQPAFDAIFAIDDAMADVVAKASDPTLAAIKLAWWRERLEALDRGEVPAEPRLQAAAKELLSRAITGHELAELEGGWATLLQEWPDAAVIGGRGAVLFRIGAGLLRIPEVGLKDAGALFAQVDVARRTGDGGALSVADELGGLRYPRGARPITAFAALAARDLRHGGPPFEPEATPGRAFALLRHRWTGRIG